ncbi:hypothetical protein [Clostridium sp. UBA7339]|uniref:hypothetical protein n=1 Tax=Clostridium sp. UBA7339 TaxID=1946376 RepID=UPI003217BBBA
MDKRRKLRINIMEGEKVKDNKKWLFITPALLIMVLSRYILAKYGSEANDKLGFLILGLVILFIICGILYFVMKKYYLLSLGILTILIPFVVYYVGLYSKNEVFKTIGVVALLLIIIGWCIFLKLYLKYKNK